MAGFWDAIGQGLQSAGGILSPEVYDQQQRQRQALTMLMLQKRMQEQAQNRALVAGAIQSGAMAPGAGAGFGLPEGLGPDAQTQARAAALAAERRVSAAVTPYLEKQDYRGALAAASSIPGGMNLPLTQHLATIVARLPEGGGQKLPSKLSPGDAIPDGKGGWTVPIPKAEKPKAQWSDPYQMGGATVQKNLETGEIRTAVSRVPQVQIMNPGQTDSVAQLIADYRAAPLSGWAMNRPEGQKIMARVRELNPDYDASNWFRKQRVEVDAGAGKIGTLTRSFNVFIQHSDVMRDAVKALDNNDIRAFNAVAQEVAKQTGRPAPTNFDAVKKIYGDELVKAIVGTGGNVSDRQEAATAVMKADSPKQLLGVLDQYDKLMAGQVAGIRNQYQVSTDRKDFDRFLMPKTKAALKKAGYEVEGESKDSLPTKPAPTQADRDWVKKHPEDAAKFEAHFGVKP